ncbi:MAG: LysR family transcriptional regulator [Pseudomonadota bacterium]
MPSALDVPHLELLVAVADGGSLNNAAQELGVTQPALTYRLREAERRLGAPLFVKGRGKRLRMTPSAERLLPSARRVLDELARAEHDVHRFAGGIRYVVRVGVADRLCPTWLPSFVKFLVERNGEITIDLVPAALHAPADALARGAADVVISQDAAKPAGRQHFELFRDTLVAVLPADHALASEPAFNAGMVGSETFITAAPVFERSFAYQACLTDAEAAPAQVLKAASGDGVLAYVAAGLGISLVGARDAELFRRDRRVAVLPLAGKTPDIVWWAGTRADEHGGSPAYFVADHLSLWCQEIMPHRALT